MRANNRDEFREATRRLKRLLERPEILAANPCAALSALVEDYLPGEEVAVEGILLDGELKLLAIFDKPDPLEGPFFEETIYVTPSRLPPDDQDEIARTVQQGLFPERGGQSVGMNIRLPFEEGPNPDVEVSRFLTERAGFMATPPFAGLIEYRRPDGEVMIVGQVQGHVPNQGDAWTYTLDAVRRFFEHVLSEKGEPRELPQTLPPLLEISPAGLPALLQELIGGVYLEAATVLGRRTAELHRALGEGRNDPAFEPEPFSLLYQRSLYQSMRNLLLRVLSLLQKNLKKLPDGARSEATRVLEKEKDILAQFHRILETKITATTIRLHGDFHLSDVLYTGKDFVIIDFEGEPGRALSERRLKRSPFKDVAGIIRSFHYAVSSALLFSGAYRPEDVEKLEPWADIWYRTVSGVYLNAYLFEVEEAPFVPGDRKEVETLLRCFLLEKAVHELGRELDNRPDWIVIPLRGIERLLKRI